MSECIHDLAEKETACNDGLCPICLQQEKAELNIILFHCENGLSHPDLQEKIDKSVFIKLQQDNEKLKTFARKFIMTECWGYYNEYDGGEIQDFAEKLGLIKQVIATADDIGEDSDYEVGDTIYKSTEILDE
jgi:hypothetical protein